MPVSPEQIRTSYPLPVYNYRVEIGDTTVAFSEVSGLSIGYEMTMYKESPTESGAPGPRFMQMPAQRVHPTITLQKGLVPAVSIASLYQWIAQVQVNQVEKRDLWVRLCDESGNPVISWKVTNAFPTKLDAPTFSATSNDAAIETLELKADFVTIEFPA